MRKSRTPVINSQIVKEDLTSVTLKSGGISTVNLPQGPLVSHSMIVLKIAKDDLQALPVNKVYLRRGWGYRAVKNYQIKTGGNTQLRVYGKQLELKALTDCETTSKRDSVLELGGPEFSGDPADLKGDLIAYVHIYLPWTNVSASKYIPYDTGLLTKPIQLQFELASASELFSYSVADRTAVLPTLPNQWKESYFMMQTALMALGPSQSIRSDVSDTGDAQYSYGWVYPGAFTSQQFQGKAESENKRNLVRLEEFQNGNLQSMDIRLVRDSAGTVPDIDLSDCQFNEAFFESMSNIEVKYGSQVIYRSDDLSNKLMSLSEYTSNNEYKVNFPNMSNLAVAGTVTQNPTKSTWVRIQLAQFNENYFSSLIQDSVSVVNNMMTIEFNVPERTNISNGLAAGTPVPLGTGLVDGVPVAGVPDVMPKFHLECNYNYLSSLNTWKGYTDFQFLPANAQGPYTMAS